MRFTRTVLLVSLLALVVVPAALALRFTDDSYNFPTATVGQSYSKQLNGAGGAGTAPSAQYSRTNRSPPPGVALSFVRPPRRRADASRRLIPLGSPQLPRA